MLNLKTRLCQGRTKSNESIGRVSLHAVHPNPVGTHTALDRV